MDLFTPVRDFGIRTCLHHWEIIGCLPMPDIVSTAIQTVDIDLLKLKAAPHKTFNRNMHFHRRGSVRPKRNKRPRTEQQQQQSPAVYGNKTAQV